jgi:polysaccharide biosynthesis protein PslG
MTTLPNPFGVLAFLHWNHEWNNWHFKDETLAKALDQLQDLGIGMVRIDILWSDIHRGTFSYDFSRYDKLISAIKAHNLEILAVLQYNKEDRKDGREIWNHPPDSFEEFAAYVGATVARYKNQIKHWEIWNEPNMSVYWAGPKDGLKRYLRLLKLSYAAAKAADPSCFVMNGGITEPILEDVNNLYVGEARHFTDAINLHTFVDPLDPKSPDRFNRIIEGVEEIMARHGDLRKNIWITEMGCPGVPKGLAPLKWFGGDCVDEDQQAEWIQSQFKLMEKHPIIERVFWAFYRDTENEFKDATDYFGLVRLDLTPKPAFHRLKKIIGDWKKEVATV